MVWVFLGLFVLAIYLLAKGKNKKTDMTYPVRPTEVWINKSSPKPPISHAPYSATLNENDDCDEIEIVGESHYQDALIAIFGAYTKNGRSDACQADLVREPKNKFDKNAVRCEIQGKLVGYVNREEAATISAFMRKKRSTRMTVTANVNGGWNRNSSDRGPYGVTVELHPTVLDPDA